MFIVLGFCLTNWKIDESASGSRREVKQIGRITTLVEIYDFFLEFV
jgi:hypothetical protein